MGKEYRLVWAGMWILLNAYDVKDGKGTRSIEGIIKRLESEPASYLVNPWVLRGAVEDLAERHNNLGSVRLEVVA